MKEERNVSGKAGEEGEEEEGERGERKRSRMERGREPEMLQGWSLSLDEVLDQV